jgi:hypothetical protein
MRFPFSGVQPEQFGGSGGGDRDELFQRDAPCADSPVKQQEKSVFDAADPIGDLQEVVDPGVLMADHAERAVVGGDDVDVAAADAVPQSIRWYGSRSGGVITYLATSNEPPSYTESSRVR